MLTAYKKYWKNYVNVTEKSTRSDYWYVQLVNFILTMIWVIGIIGMIVPLALRASEGHIEHLDQVHRLFDSGNLAIIIGLIIWVLVGVAFILANIIPNYTLLWRRFKDAGLSPYWFVVPVASLAISLSTFDDPIGAVALANFQLILELITFVITLLPSKHDGGNGGQNQEGQIVKTQPNVPDENIEEVKPVAEAETSVETKSETNVEDVKPAETKTEDDDKPKPKGSGHIFYQG